ncbi:hypothetical protein DERP_010721 [Dermatophagoides pteronyssinus]|uniref:Uncharacterized protein n=1 Tax=Dermatophagoides pteronyssinus TaxID=6956 RepID=A0ABQ8J6H7_DERPT|nr:hypothetical protein DERP_010721 [Dermatophagoides pteronyssinus]
MNKSIDLLSLRLADIEQRLYGFNTANFSSTGEITGDHQNVQQQQQPNLIEMLAEIESKLKSLTIGKDRFNQCYNELQRLQKWLREDDQMDLLIRTFGSHSSVIKFEQVLAFEDEIRSDFDRIEQINRLKSSLDQTNFIRIAELEPKLIRLKLQLFEARQQSKQLDLETKELIERFNQWYGNLIENFQQIHKDLDELEHQKDLNKYDL